MKTKPDDKAGAPGLPVSRSLADGSLKKRILLNGDSCTYFYSPEVWQPEGGSYTARAIHRFVGKLASSGVDTFVINGNTQRTWYPSRSLPRITEGYTRGNRDFFRGHAPCAGITDDKLDAFLDNGVRFLNLYLDLEEAGVDWLRETTLACRVNGMTPWVSVRMNDTHGADNPEGSYMNCPLFRDPAMRVNKHAINPHDRNAICREGLNYLRPEVREYMLAMIREPVVEYDFAGLEIDWMRDPICIPPPASRHDVEIITDFFHQVRQIADARARVTGIPFPVSLRAPGSLALLLDIGIDVRTLVREGVVDCFAPTNYYQSAWDMPFDELRRELGDRVTLFGVIEGAPNWLPCAASTSKANGMYRSMQYSPDFIRGNAAAKLVLGADSIEFFNCFFASLKGLMHKPAFEAIRDVAGLDGLRGKRKAYTFSTQFSNPGPMTVERVAQFPCVLEPDMNRSFRLPMCREPEEISVAVQVIVDRIEPLPDLGVALNGGWPVFQGETSSVLFAECRDYDILKDEQVSVVFRFPSDRICEGWNEITVHNNAHINQDGTTSTDDRLTHTVRIRSVEVVCNRPNGNQSSR